MKMANWIKVFVHYYFVFELTEEGPFEEFSVVHLKEKQFLNFSIFEFLRKIQCPEAFGKQ